MNLPNYFLADLPPEATLSPAMITEACQTLKRNREQYLAARSTDGMVKILERSGGKLAATGQFLPQARAGTWPGENRLSRARLGEGPGQFLPATHARKFPRAAATGIRRAGGLTSDVVSCDEGNNPHSSLAIVICAARNFSSTSPRATFRIPTLTSIVFGLLTRSAQFVKCASGSSFLPRMFAHSIYDADPKLGACLEIAEWRGGNAALESALFAEADCVTATGSDETLAAIRAQLPVKTRFLGYGHRVSFGFVAGEVLHGSRAKKIVAAAADDVVAWNQLGCLSPHVIYVEAGGEVSPEKFAELLADELERREQTEPRGELAAEHAAAIASRRGIYEVRAAHSPETTRHWCSKNSTAWTVVFEADTRFQMSCLNRFIYVKAVADLTAALQGADEIRGKVSTVGIAAPEEKTDEIAAQLARWGATRVCPLGQMQNPPLTWRHDGRPALGDLVTWTDLEIE